MEDSEMFQVEQRISTNVSLALRKLNSIWNELGLFGEAKRDRLSTFETHIQRMLEDMGEEEELNKQTIIKKIEKYLQEIDKLSKELNVKPPPQGGDDTPLHQLEKGVRNDLAKLRQIKEKRMEELDELTRRDEDVNVILGLRCSSPFPGATPTQEWLNSRRRIVMGKEDERNRRQEIFEETRRAIKKIMDELQIEPTLQFEHDVIHSQSKSFKLSDSNMHGLKALHQKLEQKLVDAKDEAEELREKLSDLWERLQISPDVREKFLESHPGYSSSSITALKQELKRCNELKRANIEVFVKQLREELYHWWNCCRYCEEQRAAFAPFYTDTYNEDLLELHEIEVQRLKDFYESNREIYHLIEERERLWEKKDELEKRANDPNRLFKNRGGQLLREEKERKIIYKQLPKVEQDLLNLLLAYEEEQNEAFIVDGDRLAEVMKLQWHERDAEKEMLKLQRKQTRDHQLEVESRLGTKCTPNALKLKTSALTPTPGQLSRTRLLEPRSAPAGTHLSTLKRKATPTSHTNVSKKSKGGKKSSEKKQPRSGQRSGPRFSTSKIRRFGKQGTSRALNTTHELRPSKTRRNIMSGIVPDDSILCGATSYTEFQHLKLKVRVVHGEVHYSMGNDVIGKRHHTSKNEQQHHDQLELMSAEKACRSSVVPQRCLRERNIPACSPSTLQSKTKLTLTPGRITSAVHLTLTPGKSTPVSVTPIKPPRRNGVSAIPTPTTNPHVRRTSTRLNLKTSGFKSPLASNAKLTTPRGRLPIHI